MGKLAQDMVKDKMLYPRGNAHVLRCVDDLPPPAPGLCLCVTIPAKNEACFIVDTLSALQQQVGVERSAFEVLLLINHSYDATHQKCREFKARHPEFPLHILVTYSTCITHVGAARKELMDLAHDRLPAGNGLIAMTDADTRVPKNWISGLLRYAHSDIDLICGDVAIDVRALSPFAGKMYRAKQRYLGYRCRMESLYLPEPWDLWPKHATNSGPNMAIKKSAYAAVGGMPALNFLEDAALVLRVIRKNLRIRHAPHISVATSSRLTSRVERGFGSELKYWTAVNPGEFVYGVEGRNKLMTRFAAFKMVKAFYESGDLNYGPQLAEMLKLPLAALYRLFDAHPNYRSMNCALTSILEKNSAWQHAFPNSSVFEVNRELKRFFEEHTAVQASFSQSTSS